jgi:transcriptional regulator with XRE-family HTH domain
MKLGKKVKEALNEEFVSAKTDVRLSPGKALKIYRKLQGFSQNELAKVTGLQQTTLSALENDRITLGIDRAKVLAKALKVHPGVLAFPDWDADQDAA